MRLNPPIPLPRGMTLRRHLGTLEMAWRWFGYKAVLFSLGLVFLVIVQVIVVLGALQI